MTTLVNLANKYAVSPIRIHKVENICDAHKILVIQLGKVASRYEFNRL